MPLLIKNRFAADSDLMIIPQDLIFYFFFCPSWVLGKGFEVKQRAWSQAAPHSYASPSIAIGDPRISDIFCNFVVSNQRGVCPEKGITNWVIMLSCSKEIVLDRKWYSLAWNRQDVDIWLQVLTVYSYRVIRWPKQSIPFSTQFSWKKRSRRQWNSLLRRRS